MNIKVNEKKFIFLSLFIIFGLVITACSDKKITLKGQEVSKINILKPEDKPYGFEENTYRRHDDKIETYYLSLDGGVMEDAKDANHRVYKLAEESITKLKRSFLL